MRKVTTKRKVTFPKEIFYFYFIIMIFIFSYAKNFRGIFFLLLPPISFLF